jgi:hypothetical protein
VPFALLIAISMNAPRHLLLVLLVPDKRGARTAAGSLGLGLHYLLPQFVRFGSVVYFATALLCLALAHHLREIGWGVIRADLAHPVRTARAMLGDPRA